MSSADPVRLSKLMAHRGLCSRREADRLIEQGQVYVNGRCIDTLGTKVAPDADIRIDQAGAAILRDKVSILINKPVGIVSAQAEDGYTPAIRLISSETHYTQDKSPLRFTHAQLKGLAPAGRLDIDSQGLLVLTQDGRIAKQLIGEHSEIEKEYLVRITGTLSEETLSLLRHGLRLDGKALKPAKVRRQNADQLNIILTEGKKRQIRRMCEAVGLKVTGLKRVRIGRVRLGELPEGQWRYLGDNEHF